MSVEVHSRTAILKGHPTLGIPQGSTVSVSTRPDGMFVKKFLKTEEEELACALDPGAYTVVYRSHDERGKGGMRFQEDFYVDCDKDTYKKLANTYPQLARTRQTTKGIRYICGFMGCKVTKMSRLSMVDHEAWHQGISLLKEPERKEEAKHAVMDAGASQKKKVGRPRTVRD